MKQTHYNIIIAVLLLVIVGLALNMHSVPKGPKRADALDDPSRKQLLTWTAPDTTDIPFTKNGEMIRYGRELIVHTARYFGPKGSISRAANGLNCENCHIAAGTRPFGNNFSKVTAAYPKYNPRRDQYVSVAGRVNGCMQRSMNGKALDSTSREMKAFIAYFKWIGKGVDKSTPLFGEGTEKLAFLNRAADPQKGKLIFMNNCASCHGSNGAGKLAADSTEYLYPPLWGRYSYNRGAGLFRLSKFASYVKNNMPFGTTYHNPVLTEEQAWDVAAFVDSQPHPPFKEVAKDWPDISEKPYDDPLGPYADTFPEAQHKYGPFPGIIKGELAKSKINRN